MNKRNWLLAFVLAAFAQASIANQYYIIAPMKGAAADDWVVIAPSYSSWVATGSEYNCTAWSPAEGDVDYGINYTQSRSCDQDYERTRTEQEQEQNRGDIRVTGTYTESKTENETSTQAATGTRQDWQPTTSTTSSWTDTGGPYGYTTWSPAASTQTSNFTQSRDYSQDQERTVQEREQDMVTGDTRDSGAPYTETQTVSQSESRTVTVTVSSWANSGGVYSCSAWSPSPSTVNSGQSFTQTRSCSQDQTRNWTYTADSSTIHTRTENRTISKSQSRTNTGTKITTVCKYTYNTSNGYFITDNTPFGMVRYQWGTTTWTQSGTYSLPSEGSAYTRSGYKYWAGVKKSGSYYQICRKPN